MKTDALAGCLRLRRWALDQLFGSRGDGEASEPDVGGRPISSPTTVTSGEVPDEPPDVWDVFLRRERCASELLEVVDVDGLPRATRDVLSRNALRQSQRVLAARGQLAALSGTLNSAGLEAVVLKGGAHLANGARTGDLIDLDLLVPESDVPRTMSALQAEGYAHDSKRLSPLHHELPLYLGNLLPVEVHGGLPRIPAEEVRSMHARARPLEAMPGLAVLLPVDHVWYVLLHSSLQHPHRRGCIRELLLLRAGLAKCEGSDLETLADRVARHPERVFLEPWCEMALAATRGSPRLDPFQAVAAADCLMLGGVLGRGVSRHYAVLVASLVLDALGQYPGLGPWRRAADLPSPRVRIRQIQARAPRAGKLLVVCFRWSRLLALLPPALILARRVDRSLGSRG